ncbi:MAG: UDP-glucose--hexose-1-phosphate uridylyltransferase [Olsenella sp.]|nr:UDP-glucose--hexose-1-phosphate uridylyltransferase [Olsenella sp.]
MQTSAKGASLIAAATGIVDYAAAHGLIGWGDRVWGVNAVLEAVGATGPGPSDAWVLAEGPDSPAVTLGAVAEAPDDLLAELAEVAVANGCTADTASGRDRIAMRVMGLLMPKPSEVEAMSRSLLEKDGPRAATDWFYRTCCDAGYVRRTAIARNVCWNTQTDWGSMEITINLSKPEKDPREIAAAGKASAGEKYPACQLCIENEGYPGRGAADPIGAHPARQNLRIVPITLGGERWGLQYSPYAYFNEHCIAMSATHRPMHVDRASLSCLFDFVDLLPHYFIGSNADLPIVGGSILSHDHFQGGAHVFPMMRAATSARFSLAGFSEASGEILHWPLSVLRLSSANREQLLDACDHVVQVWHSWSDESVGVVARDADGTPHNTVTPIVRRVDGQGNVGGSIYEAYLALRCNVTSPEHPLGVFHPHEEWHHIKRENIGLIEVMGLAILPPRLVGELGRVEELLVAGAGEEQMADDPLASSHSAWAAKLAEENPGLSVANVHQVVRDGVGQVFSHVLEDAGVFKWDDAGRQAQMRFVASL